LPLSKVIFETTTSSAAALAHQTLLLSTSRSKNSGQWLLPRGA